MLYFILLEMYNMSNPILLSSVIVCIVHTRNYSISIVVVGFNEILVNFVILGIENKSICFINYIRI